MSIDENETLSPPAASSAQSAPVDTPALATKPAPNQTSKKKQRPPPPPPKPEAEQLLDDENEAMDETCPRSPYTRVTISSALQRRLQEQGMMAVADAVIGRTLLTLGEIVLRHRQTVISQLPIPGHSEYGRSCERVSGAIIETYLPLLDQTSMLFMKLLREFYATKHIAAIGTVKSAKKKDLMSILLPAAGESAQNPEAPAAPAVGKAA